MKVLLVYPDELAKNYQIKRPPMGLAYAGTMLKERGHEVFILDMRLKGNDDTRFASLLKDFSPGVVGFSVIALSVENVLRLIKVVKEKSDSKVVLGGPEITLNTDMFLKNDSVDFIVRGEAERSFTQLVGCLEKGADYKDILGLGYKDNGELVISDYGFITELDELPFPDWNLFELKKYMKDVSRIKFPILTSRGCPFNCIFCDSTVINGRWRGRTGKNVVDEMISVIKKYGTDSFQVMDDNFAFNKDRVFDICNQIIDHGLKISWAVGQGFSPANASPEIFKKMKDAGCIVVYFGIESADDEVLRNIRKPFTVEKARQAIKMAKHAGLTVKAPFISGLPGSTFKKELKYIKFFKETGVDMPKMGHLVPFPHTDVYDWVKKNAHYNVPVEKMHLSFSQTRGSLDTDLLGPMFWTDEYPLEERWSMLDLFQKESELYILQKQFGKVLGKIAYILSRNKTIRTLGVKMLDGMSKKF